MCGIARRRTKQILQFAVAKKERVASRKKHVADFGMLLQIAKGFFEISVQFLFPHPTDDAAARAIAAIGSTPVRHKNSTRSGYRWTNPGTGMCESSPHGSAMS